jgi:hypothetical protein
MRLSVSGLRQLCSNHVVELKFNRRHKLPGRPLARRMLCTLDATILDSTLGKEILNFKPPVTNPPYNAAAKNLVVVWDIFFQDWRAIPIETCEVVTATPTRPPEHFWKFFDKSIAKMNPVQKAAFMDR